MDAANLARTAKVWRDRLAGHIVFDVSAAEKAIRRVYHACGLSEPGQILWVNGPAEAAEAIAFVERPPRKLRWTVLAALLLGIVASLGLVFATDGSALAAQPPATSGVVSLVFSALGLILGAGPRMPLSAGKPGSKQIALGAAVFISLAVYSFAVQRLGGLPVGLFARATALALAALVGALPTALLLWRMQYAYAPLPRSLRELSPSSSIAQIVERTQRRAWAPFVAATIGPRAEEALLQAYRSAYRQAFAPWRTWDGFSWVAGELSRNRRSESVGEVPPHLDGIANSARAAAIARADTTEDAESFAGLAFHVDRLFPFSVIAVAVRPAMTIMLDAEGRPHAEAGPALAWADGTRIFAWHGRLVPPAAFDPSRPLTRARIEREADPDLRWVLIERYGLGRYLLEFGAAEIQRDRCGRLYRLTQELNEPILAVRVVNHTAEPDGSVREFWLRVPPTLATAHEAVAWTFDLPVEAYDPIAQS